MNSYEQVGKVNELKEFRPVLEKLFVELDSNNIPYVILRKYQLLPNKTIDEDIDLLIPENYIKQAKTILSKKLNFKKYGQLKEIAKFFIKYYRKFVSSPSLALLAIDKIKNKLIKMLTLKKDEGFYMDVSYGFKHYKYKKKSLLLDIWNHLAYYSPSTRLIVRVNPDIEKLLIQRRIKNNSFWIPSPPDELLHILCRGVCDYKGEFRGYYELRIRELVPVVYKDYDLRKQFRELLNLNFYKAGDMVFDLVEQGKYNEVLKRLENFSDY